MTTTTAQIEPRNSQTVTRAAGQRMPALDWIKGSLVLLMLLYHWLSYFVRTEGLFYRYLRFVTPSFIFITGFLVSSVYLQKYSVNDGLLPRRLAIRGAKIFALFCVLNLLVTLLVRDSYSGKILFTLSSETLFAVFVTGNVIIAGGKAAAFYILVPISYVLLLSAVLLVLSRSLTRVFEFACIFLLSLAMSIQLSGLQFANLELAAIGFLGVACGRVQLSAVTEFVVSHRRVLFLAYCFYLVAITRWNVTYPLLVVGVCLSLMLLVLFSAGLSAPTWAGGTTILLGKYSLFGYITQIAVLHFLYRMLRYVAWPRYSILVLSLGAAVVLTTGTVITVDRGRRKSPLVETLYRAVFC